MLGGHIVLVIDRRLRALGDARTAVDALVGVDEQLHAGERAAALGRRHGAQLVERPVPTMQSQGQTSTHAVSQVPTHFWVITYAMPAE